jgi:hypothetical protein
METTHYAVYMKEYFGVDYNRKVHTIKIAEYPTLEEASRAAKVLQGSLSRDLIAVWITKDVVKSVIAESHFVERFDTAEDIAAKFGSDSEDEGSL